MLARRSRKAAFSRSTMRFRLPLFLRRALLLRAARSALSAGEMPRSLAILRDPCLAPSAKARELRELALESVCRAASRSAAEGDEESVAKWLARVAAEDPARAAEWKRLLAKHDSSGRSTTQVEAAGNALQRLLTEMRSALEHPSDTIATGFVARRRDTKSQGIEPSDRKSAVRRTEANETSRSMNGVPANDAPSADPSPTIRFHLAVDDGGEWLVASGSSLTIGHLRSTGVDLPFLADVEPLHVRLVRRESFHSGPHWYLERACARPIAIDGRALGDRPEELADGDTVLLAHNLAFRFRAPEASSSSAVLDLASGAECLGAVRILLFAPGAAGRVRIGGKKTRHIGVADLTEDVSLEIDRGELAVRCAGGVRSGDLAAPPGPSAGLCVPCPPAHSIAFTLGARPADRPPFCIAIRPCERLPHASEEP